MKDFVNNLVQFLISQGTHADLLLFVVLALGVVSLVILERNRRSSRRTNTYGRAHFGKVQEVRTLTAAKPLHTNILHAASHLLTSVRPLKAPSSLVITQGEQARFIVGKAAFGLAHPPIGLSDTQQESHVLLCAPTGKGKTSSIIIPNLLEEDGHKSLVINDIKRELISKCYGALQEHHTCYMFAPTRPRESHHYNPLVHVHSMEDAEDLARCIVDNTGTSSQEAFWDNASRLLLTATILHICATEPDAPLARLADILCGQTLEEIITLITKSPSQRVRKVAASFAASLQGNPKLAGSVLAEMAGRLYSLRNPQIETITADNEFDFARFLKEPTAIFLSIPAHATERLKWLSAAFTMQLMRQAVSTAELSPDGRLKRSIAFYLDEFANMGRIPHFLSYLSLVRSAGIAFILAIQNFAQLEQTYGEHGRNTILANTTTHIVFSGCGQEETEWYSRRMGNTTVGTQSESMNGQSWSFFPTTPTTRTVGDGQRPLMYPDELRTMPIDQLILLSGSLPPVRVTACPYFKNSRLVERTTILPQLPYRRYVEPEDRISDDRQTEERINEEKSTTGTVRHDPFDDLYLPPPLPKIE